MNYHDVMEAYKKPISIRYVPRIFSWLLVFTVLFGVSTTAYAMDKEPVIWVQVPQWTDDWAVCAVDIPDSAFVYENTNGSPLIAVNATAHANVNV